MDSGLKLLLIDNDPIFRLGLKTWLQQFSDVIVVAEAKNIAVALQSIAPGNNNQNSSVLSLDLIIISLAANILDTQLIADFSLIPQFKELYPHIPIFLLAPILPPHQLEIIQKLGVNGYCPKSVDELSIISAIRQVAIDKKSWYQISITPPKLPEKTINKSVNSPLAKMRLSGLYQIDTTLAVINNQLKQPRIIQKNNPISILNWLILTGRRRELKAARWLVNRILPEKNNINIPSQIDNYVISNQPVFTKIEKSVPVLNILLDNTLAKLESNLSNLTDNILEIDILKPEKKRELLYVILREFEDILNELKLADISLDKLREKRDIILEDLWRESLIDFFGKYYTLTIGDRSLELVSILLQNINMVKTVILDKIPGVIELLEHLIFQMPLTIDNLSYSVGNPEAIARCEAILQNLLIQIANAIIQPLLNNFAEIENIKNTWYDRRLISAREIARFRNELSWKYRWEKYWNHPLAVFESQYYLFVLDERGIKKQSIYASRQNELTQLSGIPLAVTLILETRDAIAPRLHSTVSFLGTGIVYILTQILGRGLGLIGKGIIQGIGNSITDIKSLKKDSKEN